MTEGLFHDPVLAFKSAALLFPAWSKKEPGVGARPEDELIAFWIAVR